MKISKKIIAGCVAALALTTTSIPAFAATVYNTPAEAAAGVTGKTVEEVVEQRWNGTTYGTIAAEEGKLDEFQQEMQEIYKDTLDLRVADATISQEQADYLLAARAERQAICNGSGSGIGGCGLGFGAAGGAGRGLGAGRGIGTGRGVGAGRNFQTGICIYQ